MGITRAALEKRIARLCLQEGLCPAHGTPLWCADCQLSWEGSEAEWQELIALAERLPYDRSTGPTPYRCGRCQQPLWCDTCFQSQLARSRRPEEPRPMPLSNEEVARYQKLSAYLTLRDRSEGLPPIRLRWADSEPMEATEPALIPEPTAESPVESHSDAPPMPASEPEPEDDPDDELEVTVRQLVDEVRRRWRP